MVFILVQEDSDSPSKIKLEPGTHIFGRGKLLNVNDKRISRLHGQLEVTDDSLVITALHQNPCFYQKSGSTQAEILRESNSVSLSSGDKLGLLPNSYWFEVLQRVTEDNEGSKDTAKRCQERNNDETMSDLGEVTDNETESRLNPVTCENGPSDVGNIESQSTNILSPCELDVEQNEEEKDFGKEDCNDDQNETAIETAGVDSTLTSVDQVETPTAGSGSPVLISTNQEMDSDNTEPLSSELPSTSQKRPLSVSVDAQSEVIKKIKPDPDVKPDIKPDSDDQQPSSSNSNNNDAVKPPSAPLRERCMYGASCYRRNPAHLAQFSHPQDADWGTGEKAPCPWGAACAKRDPRHWRDHDHPPGKEQPPPQPGVSVVHRQGNVFYINAHTVTFYDDRFETEDSDGNSVDYDYEF